MKEILFKAKRIDNGEWVEGFYAIAQDRKGLQQHNILLADNHYGYYKWYEIKPDTICQYTGLTDKDGNKIWENDVVFCKQYIGGNQIDYHIEKGYVEMKHGAFGLHRLKPDAYYRPFKDWLEDYEYEVIGNIFDNPELLKAGD